MTRTIADRISGKRDKESQGSLMEKVDDIRKKVNGTINPSARQKYAQYMTPKLIGNFMASLFKLEKASMHLLDPGAGIGSLTAAFVERMIEREHPPSEIHVTAYEIDAFLCGHLATTLDMCRQACENAGIAFTSEIRQEDFITACCSQGNEDFFDKPLEQFDCIILNPPYSKINSSSATRRQLRKIGIETSNLYTAFLALSARHLRSEGELVSITPRSFCNGPYFLPFRKYFLGMMALHRIHVFESRSKAFREDQVLQENVIMYATKISKRLAKVMITVSDDPTSKIQERLVPYERVVNPKDPNLFINLILSSEGEEAAYFMSLLPAALSDLDLELSTGRVVDFRAKEYLRAKPERRTAPLIYPGHFSKGYISWPSEVIRKPNAIVVNSNTSDLLVPTGVYVLVKRFSAKEERRRIVAAIYDLRNISDYVGFENHLNYYHRHGKGLPRNVAVGLCVFLNSTIVDKYFRLFSGHTQVNAMDLRSFRYPSIEQLKALAQAAPEDLSDHEAVDRVVSEILG